jgi:hypothetical protein
MVIDQLLRRFQSSDVVTRLIPAELADGVLASVDIIFYAYNCPLEFMVS